MTPDPSPRSRGLVFIVILIILMIMVLGWCDVRHATRQPQSPSTTGATP